MVNAAVGHELWLFGKKLAMLNLILALTRREKRAVFLTTDMALVPICMLFALVLQQGRSFSFPNLLNLWPLIVLLVLVAAGASSFLGIYRIRLKSFERSAVFKVLMFACILTVASISLARLGQVNVTLRVHATFGIIFFLACSGVRVAMLEALLALYRSNNDIKTVLIYGAGKTGLQLVSALKSHPEIAPIGFVDDNAALKGQIVHGLPVFSGAQLEQVIEDTNPARVVIAMPSVERKVIARIERRLANAGVDVQIVPSFAQIVGEEKTTDVWAPAAPRTFLGRDDLQDHIDIGCHAYAGQSIMISGAGGSIGSELCRQIMTCQPSKLVLFDHSEFALYSIEAELREHADERSIELIACLGSVSDVELVGRVLQTYDIDTILHAAAYKHVPLVETNPLVGLSNNVFGTHSLATQATEAGVKRFVLVSSDKAVRPTNVMGASKQLAEQIIGDLASRSQTTVFSSVRFGNVLGSSGSVVPLFQEQIARGGPVTLTDKDVTRYFMTVQEAAQLVLTAGSLAQGGETFVLDMGKPVPVMQLAEQVIEAAGFSVRNVENPDGDIEIVTTGLRPGEKMHEELTSGTRKLTTSHEKIFCVEETGLSELELASALKALREAVGNQDTGHARAVIQRWVHGYEDKAVQNM